MKKKLVLILISSLLLSSFDFQELNCKKFKTGEFKYVVNNEPVKIIRTDSIQIEYMLESGIEIYTKIRWISDCNYTLTYIKILNYPKDVSNAIGRTFNVEIIETKGDTMKVHLKSDVSDRELEQIKVK